MKPIKLALFDCDGTLVDSQNAIISAITIAWQRENLFPPEPSQIRRIVGLSLLDAVTRLLPSGDRATHERLTEHYKEAFFHNRLTGKQSEPLYPGLLEVLDTLAQANVILGIATGKTHRGLSATLAHHKLAHRFATLQTADLGPGKPDPAMIKRALAETGALPADTVMIGDTVFDMEMARRADVSGVGVTWGYHDVSELYAAGAKFVASSMAELTVAIRTLLVLERTS